MARKIRTARINEYHKERSSEIRNQQEHHQKVLEHADSLLEEHQLHLGLCRETRTHIEQEYLQRQDALQHVLSRYHQFQKIRTLSQEPEGETSIHSTIN